MNITYSLLLIISLSSASYMQEISALSLFQRGKNLYNRVISKKTKAKPVTPLKTEEFTKIEAENYADFMLAAEYFEGSNGKQVDKLKARYYFEKILQRIDNCNNCIKAPLYYVVMTKLALIYLQTSENEQDLLQARLWCQELLEQNVNKKIYPEAQTLLGYSYYYKNPRNPVKAMTYFKMAAQQDEDQHIKKIAQEFVREVNNTRAEGWFKQRDVLMERNEFAEFMEICTQLKDDPTYGSLAQYSLADMSYYAGDYEAARNYYEKLAEQHDFEDIRASALYILGKIYYAGYGVPQDYEKAKMYFEKTLEHYINSNKDAPNYLYYFLAQIYYRQGIPENYEKTRLYGEKILTTSDDPVLLSGVEYILGDIYLHGYGVAANSQQAKLHFEKFLTYPGNEEVHPFAEYALGLAYLELGNIEKAIEYLSKAAAQHNAESIRNLAQEVLDEIKEITSNK